MRNKHLVRFLIPLLILSVSLACNMPLAGNSPAATQTPPQPATIAPVVTQPPAQPASTETPAQEVVSNVPVPSGFIVAGDAPDVITVYDLTGNKLGDISAPGMASYDTDNYWMAGPVNGAPLTAPLVYYNLNDDSLSINSGGSIQKLVDASDFVTMTGVPAQPVLAYTRMSVGDNYSVLSRITAGTTSALANGAGMIYEFEDPNSWTLKPLAIYLENGNPVGYLYTHNPWGIGGDIVFAPLNGLLLYQQGQSEPQEILDNSRAPIGISPDLQWVASVTTDMTGSIRIQNLADNSSYEIAERADSNRGAGDLFFSLDNSLLGWMEGSGYSMSETPNFHARVRVARANGEILLDMQDTEFESKLQLGTIVWVEPLGWVSNSTLLIEVHISDWANAYVVALDVNTGSVSTLATGTFVGMTYR